MCIQRKEKLAPREILTALTKLRRPIVLALLTALRFLLISFFGGRWCSFAQMGFSLEMLTRLRKTMVTNLFIVSNVAGAAMQLNCYAIPSTASEKPTAVRARV